MLQALRSRLGSYFIKILFAVLVGSFAIWGIGDVVRAISNPDRPAIVAGSQEINAAEIGRAFQSQVNQLKQRFGQRFTAEQAAQFGVLDQTVERLVDNSLFDQEAQRLGIEVGPSVIRQQIGREPAFKDSTGVFTPNAFALALRNAGISEQEYVKSIRRDIDRQLVSGAIEAGAVPPKSLVMALERYRSEKRTADTVQIRHDSMTGIPDPTPEELATFHKDHAAQFTAPEYRKGAMLRLAVEDLAATLPVDEAQIKEEYDRNSSDYQTPERRELLQALVAEEEEAKKLVEQAKSGDFATAAKDIAKLDAEAIKLGLVGKSDLPAELGDAVFAAPEGGVTAPIKSSLGWHVFKVEKVLPATVRTIDEVRDELKAAIAKEHASDQIARLSVKLEDEIVGGGTFDEAAKKLNLKIVEIGPIDRNGLGPGNVPVGLPATDRTQLLNTLFSTEAGKASGLVETDRGDFFVLRTDSVTPAELKPIEQVKDEVTQAWLTEKRAAAAKAKADDVFAKVKAANGDLAKVAADSGLAVETIGPVARGRSENVAPQVAAAIFGNKPSEVARASAPDAEVVVKVKEILAADAAEAEKQVTDLGQRLRGQVAQDLSQSFSQGLRQRYTVKIDQQQIQKMY